MPEVQSCLQAKLDLALEKGDPAQIKHLVVQMVEEVFGDPRASNLKGTAELVQSLTGRFTQKPAALLQLAVVVQKDYTTAVHSVNLAASPWPIACITGSPPPRPASWAWEPCCTTWASSSYPMKFSTPPAS